MKNHKKIILVIFIHNQFCQLSGLKEHERLWIKTDSFNSTSGFTLLNSICFEDITS